MTNSLRDAIGFHAEALKLGERRGAILASNIAQAATPGYKARDIDFAAELARRTGTGTLAATHSGHLTAMASPDGGLEQTKFAENALRQQASLTFLNRRISGLMTAIRGE